MIITDPRNARARQLQDELGDLGPLPEDLVLVLGGDGTLLRAIHERGAGPLYLGLNCGTLGFLLNDVQDPARVAELVRRRAWSEQRVGRLVLTGETLDGREIRDYALNDVYLERATGQAAWLRVWVDGIEVVDRLVCDGIIAATAVGSTAYSMAAGGPACHSALGHIQLTAIAPHKPRLPPILLPLTSTVEVEVLDGERRPVRAVSDGRDHPAARRVVIADARSDVRLGWLEGHSPTATLIRKLIG